MFAHYRVISLSLMIMLAAAVALAQDAGGGAAGGGSAGGSSGGAGGGSAGGGATGGSVGGPVGGPVGGAPTPSRGIPTTPAPSQRTIEMPRPIFITGRVMLDDGTAPSDRVVIERVCSSRVIREGYTDSKGYFSLTLGDNRNILPDASDNLDRSMNMGMPGGMMGGSGGMGNSGMMGGSPSNSDSLWACELRAALSGYRSDNISLSMRRYMDNPEVGVIILHNMAKITGLTTSATTSMAPKDARKAYEKGLEAVKKLKPDDAQKLFLQAVQTYPRFAAAWFELGCVYEQRDHLPEAREAYDRSMAADGNYLFPYERIYLMDLRDSKWEEAAVLSEKVMRMNPLDFPGAYYFNAVANLNMGKLDVAEKSAREAAQLKGRQSDPRANFVLGAILARKGEFPAAAELLREFVKTASDGGERERATRMLSQVEQLLQAKTTEP